MTDFLESADSLSIKLRQVATGNNIDAKIVPLSSRHLDDFRTFWVPRLPQSLAADSHWDWAQKWNATSRRLNYELYAVEVELIAQGMMMIEIDLHRSRLQAGRSLVYVDYLATAPWNRPTIQNPPQFKGVGSALYQLARQRSYDLEYGGVIGLHSLPDAEDFYRKQGMEDLGPDPEKQNLRYFELKAD